MAGLTNVRKVPRVGTAHNDDPAFALMMYERLRRYGAVSFLSFFPWLPENLRAFTLEHELIVVGGGNTANMLAVWRVHGFDAVLREAWQRGAVLTGWSAGMICWFEAGVTDSFGPQLAGMRDGVAFPAGYAADDVAGLHFVGTELHEVVTTSPEARAYRITPEAEEPLPARVVGSVQPQ